MWLTVGNHVKYNKRSRRIQVYNNLLSCLKKYEVGIVKGLCGII